MTSPTWIPAMFIARVILFALLLPGTFTIAVPAAIIATGHAGQGLQRTPWHWLGLLPIAAGAALVIWCIVDFARLGRGTLAPVDPPRLLVVRGWYRHVRNPMYLGVITVLLGEALLFASSGLLCTALGFFLCTHCFVVLYEEPSLSRRFGDSYHRYRRQVHRWLPVFRRRSDG